MTLGVPRGAASVRVHGLRIEVNGDGSELIVTRGDLTHRVQLGLVTVVPAVANEAKGTAMLILNTAGGPYLNALDATRDQDGDWFSTDPYDVITISTELEVGAALSGELSGEFTADPQRVKGISPIIFPDGSLHTALAAVTLPTARNKASVASASSGTFSLTFSAPGVGMMRFRWKAGGGGIATPFANKVTAHAQGRKR